MSKLPIIEAAKHGSRHRDEVLSSDLCGCYYCTKTFQPSEITEWIEKGQTALCPRCGIDSVLGSESGYPLERTFLQKMYKYWFSAEHAMKIAGLKKRQSDQ